MSQEIKKLIVAVISVVVTVAVARLMEEPDTIRTAKMRVAQRAQSWCNRRALFFLNAADRAEMEYEKARL
jgi:hypothetical protein